ncbi:MAG TPA: hypothetical protein VK071_00560 [Tissierellales bacterium]|nr:hypothetical protein [Tissierellales bacterium]
MTDTNRGGLFSNILGDDCDNSSILFFFLLLVVIFCSCDRW